ncbi:MAG: glutaredoxin 2 [Saezia sp.]
MKLYIYDHCPYCVRAEMVGHYKQVHFQTVYLLNDDDDTCYRLINAKQVPILELDDGYAMPESLDIAQKFDLIGNPAKEMSPKKHADGIVEHINTVAIHTRCLLFPRNIMLEDLPEFATQSAKDYFQQNKEELIERTFQQAMQETPEHKAAVEKMLATLPPLPNSAQKNNMLGWDDVLIYPILRNLTAVKNLVFPQQVLDYMESVKRITNTHTYFDRAI